jgi:hypothetical protein
MADALIQADQIHTFNTHHVAFFRPIKRTYVVLNWHQHVRKWLKFTGDLPNLSLHRSLTTDNGAVSISIATRPNGRAELINVRSRGYYLQSGNTYITLLEKTGALPAPFNTVDYPLANPTLAADLTEVDLWLTQPPPLAAPLPVVHAVIAINVPLKPIPKRIAWIIAEEAKDETCPILAEPISPITAAVTTCFHVFDYEAINEWFIRNPVNTRCPVCRDLCLFTKAFD